MKNRNGQVGVMVLWIVIGLMAVIGLTALGTFWGYITLPWLKFDRQVQTNQEIIKKTYNADNALYNYHWFQERAASIVALERTIGQSERAQIDFAASAGPRKDWTFEDKNEDARLRQVVSGQKAQYNSLVEEYNARAGEVDRNIFKDGLPLFFSIKPY